jgi:hypothetical protein
LKEKEELQEEFDENGSLNKRQKTDNNKPVAYKRQ